MDNKCCKVLFDSGSLGLGHVTRDLAIVKEFRKIRPDAEIVWLASEPAGSILKQQGEKLLPESDQYGNDTDDVEKDAKGFSVNLSKHIASGSKVWGTLFEKFVKIVEREKPNLIIGDEAAEINVSFGEPSFASMPPTIAMFDYGKLYSMTNSPKDKLVVWMVNRYYHKAYSRESDEVTRKKYPAVFLGDPEDVPDEKLGLTLMNAREGAKKGMTFVGDIVRFNPNDYRDKQKVREKLGYGNEKLIICTIGGTNIGRSLLELCAKSYPIIKDRFPDLRMILVAGPRCDPGSFHVPKGVEVKGYVPDLYEHFAASDLTIVQAGGTSCLELTALNRPFLFFPLAEHFEQGITVSEKMKRLDAGVRMEFAKTTPQLLAETIWNNLGKEVHFKQPNLGGDRRIAEMMDHMYGIFG